MKPLLGMYIHMHWGYNHPYAARTWTLDDWRGYLRGLNKLGYNLVMIWPILETMPDPPTESDIAHLRKLSKVIDIAHSEFGMQVFYTLGPNTVGNDNATNYPFESRPFFCTDLRLNPADPAEMERLLTIRRELLGYLKNADGAVIIDSDPGGYIGSTNDEFADLLFKHLELVRELNPSSRLYYWMWVGWESYNRFWKESLESDNRPGIEFSASDCEAVVKRLMERTDDSWGLLSCGYHHEDIVERYGLQDRAICLPYGLVEGEPTFPMTNFHFEPIREDICRIRAKRGYKGLMVNSQTHAVQQPNAYLVSHFAQGGEPEAVDAVSFAGRLVPGAGELISESWQVMWGDEPDRMRLLAIRLNDESQKNPASGDLSGLLLQSPGQYLKDLSMQLAFRADMVEFIRAMEEGLDWRKPLLALVDSWSAWQKQTGFRDAYGGPVEYMLRPAFRKLGNDEVDAVLADFGNWRDPSVRMGIVPRLLDALRKAAE